MTYTAVHTKLPPERQFNTLCPPPYPSPTTLCSRRVAAEVKGHVTCYIKCFPFAIRNCLWV